MFLVTPKFYTPHTLCPSYNKRLQTSYTVCVCSFQHPGFTQLIHCVPPVTNVYKPHTLCVCSFQHSGFTHLIHCVPPITKVYKPDTLCVCSFQHPGFTRRIHCVPPKTNVYKPHTLCVCVPFNTQVLHSSYTASIL